MFTDFVCLWDTSSNLKTFSFRMCNSSWRHSVAPRLGTRLPPSRVDCTVRRSGQAGQASGHTGRSYFGWCCGLRHVTRLLAARAGEGGRAGESSWRQTTARCLSAPSPSRPQTAPPRSVPLALAYGFARPNARRNGWGDRPINSERRAACLRALRLLRLEITFLLNTFVAVYLSIMRGRGYEIRIEQASAGVCG